MPLRFQRFASSSGRKVSQLLSRRKEHRGACDLRFPIEIWEFFIDFLFQLEVPLFPLLTIHSALHRLVERVLYRNIELSGDYLHHLPRRVALFKRLADYSQVAQLVESFILHPLITHTKPLNHNDAGRYHRALHGALCAMVNLRSLTIAELTTKQIWAGTPWRLDPLFYGCKFRLRHLTMGPFHRERLSILEGQQHLVEELVIQHRLEQQFSASAFPNLRILELTSYVDRIPHLLSEEDRQVTALHWRSWEPLFHGGPFLGVKSLRLSVMNLEVSQLCATFPSLAFLRLDYHMELNESIERFVGLSQLCFLRKLVFGGGGPLGWRNFAFRRSLALSMFSGIPLLQSVSLGLELWEREQGERVLLVSNSDEWKDKKWWD